MNDRIPINDSVETPPRARGIPLLGVLPQVWKNPLQFFLDTAIEYGGIVRINMGPNEMHLVTDPQAVQWVLQENNKNYVKGYDKAKPLFGEGLLTAEGDNWLRQRRLMSPAFSRGYLATLLPMMPGPLRSGAFRTRTHVRASQVRLLPI